ncbi:hypothetical protein HAX54_031255 [Datura stramonium]|uniref:Uncharacterized protein n=1 Tax=Datura stramonium TaxID=4076 RepID=A0ABS8V9P2_DATST|nr:hypothetical protein [Datura stramonium]
MASRRKNNTWPSVRHMNKHRTAGATRRRGTVAEGAMRTHVGASRHATRNNINALSAIRRGRFGGLLTQFLRGHDIEEEEVDYRPSYDLRGIDVTKIKEPESIKGPFLSINEHNARIGHMLSHLYDVQML